MRNILLALALIVIVSSSAAYKPIPGKYVFVFHNNITSEEREKTMSTFLSASLNHKIHNVWNIGEYFSGFYADSSAHYTLGVKNNAVFKHVEQDLEVSIAQNDCKTQQGATWGINRVSEREVVLAGTYDYENTGKGVDAYVIDTGIQVNHPDFEGRSEWGINYVDTNNQDCNGHGTHVAGTIGSKTWGIAKEVHLIGVKVLNCAGSGSYAGVINGINWAANQAGTRGKKGVANLSLGGGLYQPVNDAIDAAVRKGVTMVVAAGNDANDACKYSPASAQLALTVGSTDVEGEGATQRDTRSVFSNFGPCVDVFAPGTQITSTWISSGIRTISGTSMAAPHVCGVAALYFEKNNNHAPADFLKWVQEQGTHDSIVLNCGSNAVCNQSPNILAHSSCDIGM